MLRTCCISRNERKINVCRHNARQLNLSLFCGFLKSLHSHFIFAQINTVFLLEFACHVLDYSLVEVIAAEHIVTVRCENFKYAVAYFKYRYIECTAAEVVYQYLLALVLFKTVCKSSCRRLVYDSEHFKTGNFACVLCSLSLAVAEVCRNSNNGLRYRLADVSLSVCL